MKTIIVILFLFISANVYGQRGFDNSYKNDTVTYAELQKGKPYKRYFTSYVAKNGDIFSVGDSIKILKGSGFQGGFLFIQKSSLWDIEDVEACRYVAGSYKEIKKIFVAGFKRSGYLIKFQIKGNMIGENLYIVYEDALNSGEIKSKSITSNEALELLKKAKTKLDLDLISQEEYDKIKEELKKYIK